MNLDFIFDVLGRNSIINTGIFYIENLYFMHQKADVHFCENQRYKYLQLSQNVKFLRQIKDSEIENGIVIPNRFIKIDVSITKNDYLNFINKNEILTEFDCERRWDIDIDKIKNQAKGRKLVIFGAGSDGQFISGVFLAHGQAIHCFCDNNVSLHGTFVSSNGKKLKVISFEELVLINKVDKILVIISPLKDRYKQDIQLQLAKSDIKSIIPATNRIYPFKMR